MSNHVDLRVCSTHCTMTTNVNFSLSRVCNNELTKTLLSFVLELRLIPNKIDILFRTITGLLELHSNLKLEQFISTLQRSIPDTRRDTNAIHLHFYLYVCLLCFIANCKFIVASCILTQCQELLH